MIFGKKKGIIYIKRTGLVLFSLKGASFSFDFPKDAIADLEMLDSKKLESTLSLFITDYKIKPITAAIVLSPQVYFQKVLAQANEPGAKSEIEQFLDEVPFQGSNIVHKIIEVDKSKYIFATNKPLYEIMRLVLVGLGFEIGTVIPLTALAEFKDIQEKNDFDAAEVKKVFNQAVGRKETNFLTDGAMSVQEVHVQSTFKPNLFIIGAFITAAVVIAGISVLAFLQLTKQKPSSPIAPVESTPSATTAPNEEEATTSAEVEEAKKTLTISVLNGSGVAGMAADVRDRLEDRGFAKVEIGNARDTPVEETSVVFTDDVPGQIRGMIVAELEKIFLTVVEKESEDKSDVAITVTTGTELVNQ